MGAQIGIGDSPKAVPYADIRYVYRYFAWLFSAARQGYRLNPFGFSKKRVVENFSELTILKETHNVAGGKDLVGDSGIEPLASTV